MTATAALLDRAVLGVDGPEARDLLQRLVTNDVAHLEAGQARYAALLSPQGKIVTDFLIVAQPDGGFLLDVPLANAADLARKLGLYKLRAKVTIADRSTELGIIAYGAAPPCPVVLSYADPRDAALWSRAIVDRQLLADWTDTGGQQAYREQRIRAGVPEGGLDFPYGETFPHDANLDHLNGVDFKKGCYVGQEVVSRVEHRGTARKRIAIAAFTGAVPPVGAEIAADGIVIGTMGGSVPGLGLALVRLDRAAEATGPVTAAGIPLQLMPPAWAAASTVGSPKATPG